MSRDFLGYSEHDSARVSRQRSFAIEVHPNLFSFLEIFKAQTFGMEFFWVLIFGPIRSSLSVEIRSTPPPPGKILVPSTDCDVISCNGQVVKRSFKPYQNEHDLVKDTGEKGKT